MTYYLSVAKLQTYHRCHRAYYFRYQRRVQGPSFFGSSPLGTALHAALAQFYGQWHYLAPTPDLGWLYDCWEQNQQDLSPRYIEEGRQILQTYYDKFVLPRAPMRRPIAVEGRIQGTLLFEDLEFTLTGRYDRLDSDDHGLELIDYKSTKDFKLPESDELDLQLGLYSIALQQRYQQQLKRVSLIYLRHGERYSVEVTPEHQQRVNRAIRQLALQLRHEQTWQANTGEHCDRCTYARYCSAIQSQPEPLPPDTKPEPELQLTLRV